MKVAVVQHDIVWEDQWATLARLKPQIAAAAATGARLIVLSEMFSTGFSMSPSIREPFNGPASTFLREEAIKHDVWIVGSCAELPEGASNNALPFNTMVLAGPDSVHRYRKIHPFTYGGEAEHFQAGAEFVTVSVEGIRLSLFVCYDLRFADEFWSRATETDAYVVVANWPEARRVHWQSLLQARAIENQAYVIACNRVGEGGGLAYAGDSRIVDPLGEIVASAARTEALVVAEIDAAQVAGVRDRFRFLQDRR
jgi:predicted amidohydrolase